MREKIKLLIKIAPMAMMSSILKSITTSGQMMVASLRVRSCAVVHP